MGSVLCGVMLNDRSYPRGWMAPARSLARISEMPRPGEVGETEAAARRRAGIVNTSTNIPKAASGHGLFRLVPKSSTVFSKPFYEVSRLIE
jgi:hypothetical protein